jgi:hypothetical protein
METNSIDAAKIVLDFLYKSDNNSIDLPNGLKYGIYRGRLCHIFNSTDDDEELWTETSIELNQFIELCECLADYKIKECML